MWRGLFLCSAIAVVWSLDPNEKVVQTNHGKVKGHKEDGVFVFYGIPYATAPVGVNKFKAPLPPPIWLETLDAVNKNIVCPQANVYNMTSSVDVREDCLIANVYVPNTEETNLPVLVMVHGGAYQMGSSSELKPKKLVNSKKIIAVTFNYRLGIHGFLCLGTKRAPGNTGLKDQVALLRWVQKNIAKFGGNPDDVTLLGVSAGASAVDLLQLSKATKGLFSRIITESGSNLAVWSVQSNPLKIAQDQAIVLGFDKVDDIQALEEFYTSASFEELTADSFMFRKDSFFGFSPCVEQNIGEETILEDAPYNILKQGHYNKFPMLYGFANMEGLLRLMPNVFDHWSVEMNEKFSDFLPADLQFENGKVKEVVARKVREFYFGDKPVDYNTAVNYVNYFSDVIFTYPALRSLKLQLEAGNNKIYLYEYSFKDKEIRIEFGLGDVAGAPHCAQTVAIQDGASFGTKIQENEEELTEDYKTMKKNMRELWSNFIKTGTPVPDGSSFPAWPPVQKDNGPYMSLDTNLELRESLLLERFQFWESIYEDHYQVPIPPSKHAIVHSEL